MSQKPRRLSDSDHSELPKQKHLFLRILGFVIALAVAASAFAYMIYTLLWEETGWQQMQPYGEKSGITNEFVLTYNISGSESKSVASCYTNALEHAYDVFRTDTAAVDNGLYSLNAHPNEEIAADPLLYRAFELVQQSGSRYPYYGPLAGRTAAITSCETDEDAQLFDYRYSEAVSEFTEKTAAFARDSSAVQVQLLPEGKLKLSISESYLAFAAENEITVFVDFGILRNAFLTDAAADALAEQGFTHGIVASLDGYTRLLCTDEMAVNVIGREENLPKVLGAGIYHGIASLVVYRSFPAGIQDDQWYRTYSDGTVYAPYICADGGTVCAADYLAVQDYERSCAQAALQTIGVFTAQTFEESALEDFSWIAVSGNTVLSGGDQLRFKTIG